MDTSLNIRKVLLELAKPQMAPAAHPARRTVCSMAVPPGHGPPEPGGHASMWRGLGNG